MRDGTAAYICVEYHSVDKTSYPSRAQIDLGNLCRLEMRSRKSSTVLPRLSERRWAERFYRLF